MKTLAEAGLPAQVPRPHGRFSRPARFVRYFRTPKGLLTLVYLMLFAVGGTGVGWTMALPHVTSAVLSASLVDVVMGRLIVRVWRWPTSALLSGFTSAFVLSPNDPWGVSFAVGGMAVLSKYSLGRKGHVFNPAALALLVSIPLFSTGHSWWGSLGEVPLPWTAVPFASGLFIVDRLNKFPLVFGFLGSYFCFFVLAGLSAPTQVSEIFRAPFLQAALFAAFFMVTDPPTSPTRSVHQLWVGVLDGAVCCASLLMGAGQAYLLLGVLAGNAAFALSKARGVRVNDQ